MQFTAIDIAEATLADLFAERQGFEIDLPFFAQFTPDVLVVLRWFVDATEFLHGLIVVPANEDRQKEHHAQNSDRREKNECNHHCRTRLLVRMRDRGERRLRAIVEIDLADEVGQIVSYTNLYARIFD